MNSSFSKNRQLRVLMFGSTGFLGRNLREQLGSKYQLIMPSKKELPKLLSSRKYFPFDVLVYLINAKNYKENMRIFEDVFFEFLPKRLAEVKRIIFLGSGAEYDKRREIRNVREEEWDDSSTEEVVEGDYAKSKQDAARIFSKVIMPSYGGPTYQAKTKLVYLRPFGVFGKYEDYARRFISRAILDNMEGKPITIYQNVKFSYVWVNDLVKIIDYFITYEPKHKFYNVCGHQLTLKNIAKKIGKYKILKKGWANEYTCDDSRVREETGIEYTPFDESLESLRRFYETTHNSQTTK